MKKLLFIAIAAFLFTHCSETELTETSSDNLLSQDLELRMSCPPGEWSVLDLGEIQEYGITLGSCDWHAGCEGICSKPIDSCMDFGANTDCISPSDIQSWINSFLTESNDCGNSYEAFCNPTITLDHPSFKNGRFELCVSGNVWRCPFDLGLTLCEEIKECLIVENSPTCEGPFTINQFGIINTCEDTYMLVLGQTEIPIVPGANGPFTLPPTTQSIELNVRVRGTLCLIDTLHPLK